MKNKKLIIILTVLALLAALLNTSALAVQATTCYVTIVSGTVAVAQQAVTVTDVDNDGALTVSDALYLAHEAAYEGGAAQGYATAQGQFGLMLTKLWGTSNGGSYGYYVNNSSAAGLGDEVSNGDYINAFVYSDIVGFTDTYCYFDKNTVTAAKGGTVSLTLFSAGYDNNWMPVVTPVADADILINGAPTAYKTDANGSVTVTLDEAQSGVCILSAHSGSVNLVPPVCKVNIEVPPTGDNGVLLFGAVPVLGAIMLLIMRRKNAYEK